MILGQVRPKGVKMSESADSRLDGTVSLDRIESRPWLIIWPLSRFGFVNR
ncbi:MAG: hypothetical protein ACYTBJ_13140 [Planctomycetota bacterium]|jgi:hypothetical protein